MDNIDHGATTRESQRAVGAEDREVLREKTPRATSSTAFGGRDGERKEERRERRRWRSRWTK